MLLILHKNIDKALFLILYTFAIFLFSFNFFGHKIQSRLRPIGNHQAYWISGKKFIDHFRTSQFVLRLWAGSPVTWIGNPILIPFCFARSFFWQCSVFLFIPPSVWPKRSHWAGMQTRNLTSRVM